MEYLYLAHHGIKGQRWGVRRYQNPDGTLTPLGKVHYTMSRPEMINKAEEYRKKAEEADKAFNTAMKLAVTGAVSAIGSRATRELVDNLSIKLNKQAVNAFNKAGDSWVSNGGAWDDVVKKFEDQYIETSNKLKKSMNVSDILDRSKAVGISVAISGGAVAVGAQAVKAYYNKKYNDLLKNWIEDPQTMSPKDRKSKEKLYSKRGQDLLSLEKGRYINYAYTTDSQQDIRDNMANMAAIQLYGPRVTDTQKKLVREYLDENRKKMLDIYDKKGINVLHK